MRKITLHRSVGISNLEVAQKIIRFTFIASSFLLMASISFFNWSLSVSACNLFSFSRAKRFCSCYKNQIKGNKKTKNTNE